MASIDRFYLQEFSATDVTVRNATSVSDQPSILRGMIDRSLLGRVSRVPGVAVAEPVIQGSGQLLDKHGKTFRTMGPRIAGNWITVPSLNPYHIVAGRAPRPASDGSPKPSEGYPEVVIDRKAANDGHLRVGDRTGLLTPQRITVKIVGIAKFGSQDAFGGGSFTAFALSDAQSYIAQSPNAISSISVKADPGVTPDELRRRIQVVLPPGVQAITGQALAQENLSITNKSFLNLFRTFLLTFAAVALLVSSFSIANTFSIVVAQRSRESALLRTIGASRSQVLISVVVEGLAIALIASIAGLAGGLGIAALLESVFSRGFGVPISGMVFTPAVGTIAVATGMVVTLLACLLPAARASRVPPLAALRDATVESTGTSRTRTMVGSLLLIVALLVVVTAALRGGNAGMGVVGVGALAGVVGVITLLYLAYGMLAFAILIALMGIGNTLSLSLYERTRELGLLRAVGATRTQLRIMVRWESLIVALFGTLAGLVFGLFIGWGLATGISQTGTSAFSVPIAQLIIILVVGAVTGVLAAIRPAGRAACLNLLDAIATE